MASLRVLPQAHSICRSFRLCRTAPAVNIVSVDQCRRWRSYQLICESRPKERRITFAFQQHRRWTYPCRVFSSTRTLNKKGKNAKASGRNAGGDEDDASPSSKSKPSGKAVKVDPFDLEELKSDIAKALGDFKTFVASLSRDGRLKPDDIDGLRVKLDKGKQERMSAVAQVIPKGRIMEIIVGDKTHVKPVTAAIAASPFSVTAQPDPTGANPLLLTITVPPATAESRRRVATEARNADGSAHRAITAARAKQQKKFRSMMLEHTALPDDVNKAMKKMNDMCSEANKERENIAEATQKSLA